MGNITKLGQADDYLVVSMGDEIQLSVPSGDWGNNLFQSWCKTLGIPVPGKFNDTLCE